MLAIPIDLLFNLTEIAIYAKSLYAKYNTYFKKYKRKLQLYHLLLLKSSDLDFLFQNNATFRYLRVVTLIIGRNGCGEMIGGEVKFVTF